MKNYKFIVVVAAFAAILCSCSTAVVKGHFTAVPSSNELVVKSVEGSTMAVLDTVRIASDGSFKYSAKVAKGQPDFVYFYYGDTKVASLVLSSGDKVSVECDTLGYWTVSGSEECEALLERERALTAMAAKKVVTAKEFIDFYRESMKYVMNNSKSITCVPVLLSKIGDAPVFFQLSDGMVFNNVADSLETVFPDSKYIKVLRAEGAARCRQLEFDTMIRTAGEASYIDLNFDGIEGKPVVLSEVAEEGKATMLVFWSAADAANKMYNQEVLLPLYKKYASRGLNIYAVCVGCDKASWAVVVREQNLPWTNVCDQAGRSIRVYGVQQVPTAYILNDNLMTRAESVDYASLDRELSKILK